MAPTDWVEWHESYSRSASSLPARLAAVQAQIDRRLDATAPRPHRAVSLCAGDGRDLLGVLARRGDADVRATVAAMPQRCAPGAEVVWTRHCDAPDLTPQVRRWFGDAGFEEVDVTAPVDAAWCVGVHRLATDPQPLRPDEHWFDFVGRAAGQRRPSTCAPGRRLPRGSHPERR